ncbi:DUF262 domain-containing protein [Microbulbifer sp. ANSA005]|uniref:DUF262 domain-containing protein n=1 Tax=Microbulbifer sp. ANSA005 TaxID=3243362 RepID=UPI004042EE2D
MSKVLERASNNITVSTFYEEYLLDKYNMDPAYQRRSVWSDEKKSFFVDSVLKNLPIPPVFLRQNVDDTTGKTTYEVIDGKQRLSSLVDFINGEFPTADEADDPLHDESLAGRYFSEIEGEDLGHYKKRFWRYLIPVEYVDTDDDLIIDKIFDRLNRNGEALTGQELRHSNYYSSPLLKLCYEVSKTEFWSNRLNVTDKSRMEDIELVSELVFVLLENKELKSTDEDIDQLYLKYAENSEVDWGEISNLFYGITEYMERLSVPYEEYKVQGVSHLYGLWCFSKYCVENGIDYEETAPHLIEFYRALRGREYDNEYTDQYRKSMSYSTKMQGQRKMRKEALIGFCDHSG